MGFFNDLISGAGSIVGGAVGGASDILYGKPPPVASYAVDPNAFIDPEAEATRARLAAALQQSQQRTSPLPGEDVFRQGQMAQLGQLQQQASGQAPSIAEAGMRQAQDRNLAQQQGAMASNRGVGSALAQRMLAQNAAQSGQQLASNVGMAKLQEQQGAQANLASALAQGRGADIQAGGLNDQMARFYQQAMMDKAEADRQAKINQQTLGVNQAVGFNTAQQNAYGQQSKNRGGVIGGLGAMLGMGG